MQTVTQLPRGHKLSLPAGKRTVVDRKRHLDGRFADFDKGKRLRVVHRRHRIADRDVGHPGNTDDIADLGLGDRGSSQSVNLVHVHNLGFIRVMLFMVVADHDLLVLMNFTLFNPADGDSADVLVIVNRRNQHLQRCGLIALRRRDVVLDRLK